MGTGEETFEGTLSAADAAAANALTRRWLASRAALPPAASGLGVWPLLAVLASGAVGDTRAELLEAVGTDDPAVPARLLAAAKDAPALSAALAVWAGGGIALDPEWTAGLPSGAVGSLTGDPAADQAALDDWASRATGGRIPALPLDFAAPIDLVLASALTVATTWAVPFKDHHWPFAAGPWAGLGPVRQLTANLRGEVLRVADNASVLTVAGDGDIDVLLCLGRAHHTPHAVMETLFDALDPDWGLAASALTPGSCAIGVEVTEYMAAHPQAGTETEVQTVRFSLDAELDLTEDAAALGLVLACDEDRAAFDRLAARPVHVSQARQACTAVFSATGFEAAAVTAAAMLRAASVPKFEHRHLRAAIRFDRPFAYLARHRPTGLVLVAGWVAEPETA